MVIFGLIKKSLRLVPTMKIERQISYLTVKVQGLAVAP
jgi:hypothetical protein